MRDRRTLSEDGVLIIVATIAGSNGAAAAMPELIARGLTEPGPLLEEMRARRPCPPRPARPERPRDQAAAGALTRRSWAADLRQNGEAPDDSPRHSGSVSTLRIDPTPGWAEALADRAAEQATARNLIGQLVACEVAALAFCRLLERWARGRPSRAPPESARLRSDALPSGRRRRSSVSSGRSVATCSSSSRIRPRGARGTASRARPS